MSSVVRTAVTPHKGAGAQITVREVQTAFEPVADRYPPILFLKEAAQLSGYTPGTLKKKVSEGCFRNSVARGKPLRFWRDRFVLELMNKTASSKPAGKEADNETR